METHDLRNCVPGRALFCAVGLVFSSNIVFAETITPFNACTFSSNSFSAESFASGDSNSGCAEWSVSRGRGGCKKVKGVCPLCVTYAADHLQMWLPEFFIELTTAPGESVFTVSSDGLLVKKQIEIAEKYWKNSTVSSALPIPSSTSLMRSLPETISNSIFWHARVLVMPYANLMGSFSPLPAVRGSEAPTCFAGLSEFFPTQWNYNSIDAPYALAWSGVGNSLCNTPRGATISGGIESAKNQLSKLGILGKEMPSFPGEVCARPVGKTEGNLKMLRPSSDALSPLLNPANLSAKLCMGSWGNLLPRTGYAVTSDTFISAMQSAYKFTSLVADLNLNDNYKLRSDDKFQIVFPRVSPAGCFKPGAVSVVNSIPHAENIIHRQEHELKTTSERKGTYVIAVWRKRETCEEPLETVGGWSATHKLQIKKNKAICSAMHSKGGER